ncbi:type II toxin-antitoxin system HicA family toxin [Nitrospirillum viridazoti]|uniref:HicA-like toxin of HicAB toxin-antitoxin system n=1 Tax=Nitrospirillum amazonense TaxID=28077 RepID=A0A560IXG8_9PROT|nr:type II toxin-antitoxin system HicA family toxin [Nitrospirillum amazonense]TWB63698.1 HicA-like toxin of HicAB toxin-antitoxin system [Nitrospirillum amazonense]
MASLYIEIIRILREHGCVFVRQGKGDHEIWRSPITNANFPIDKKTRSHITANMVMKQAGIPHRF